MSLDLVLVTGKSYIIKALVFPELPQCTTDVRFEVSPSQAELLICHHEMSLFLQVLFQIISSMRNSETILSNDQGFSTLSLHFAITVVINVAVLLIEYMITTPHKFTPS